MGETVLRVGKLITTSQHDETWNTHMGFPTDTASIAKTISRLTIGRFPGLWIVLLAALPTRNIRTVAICDVRPHLQWRVRNGFLTVFPIIPDRNPGTEKMAVIV